MMRLNKFVHIAAIMFLLVLMLNLPSTGAAADSTPDATTASTQDVPNCTQASASATGTATADATLTATSQATTEATSLATQAADAPLNFVSFLPTDMKFNPSNDKPVVVVMVFSLIFQNRLGEALHVENPQFQLSIDNVTWGKVASTDFQTGQLLAHATHGIVLQSLTIVGKTTDAQKAILECLKNNIPVDLTLTGTVDAFPGGNKQTVSVTLITRHIVIRGRQ
jgi:hypothetical protein